MILCSRATLDIFESADCLWGCCCCCHYSVALSCSSFSPHFRHDFSFTVSRFSDAAFLCIASTTAVYICFFFVNKDEVDDDVSLLLLLLLPHISSLGRCLRVVRRPLPVFQNLLFFRRKAQPVKEFSFSSSKQREILRLYNREECSRATAVESCCYGDVPLLQ